MLASCDGPPKCNNCPETSAHPCLLLEWMGFLTGIEALAEREARANGQPYQRCPDDVLSETARLAAASGMRPRTSTRRS
jgi:hypothetical protein